MDAGNGGKPGRSSGKGYICICLSGVVSSAVR